MGENIVKIIGISIGVIFATMLLLIYNNIGNSAYTANDGLIEQNSRTEYLKLSKYDDKIVSGIDVKYVINNIPEYKGIKMGYYVEPIKGVTDSSGSSGCFGYKTIKKDGTIIAPSTSYKKYDFNAEHYDSVAGNRAVESIGDYHIEDNERLKAVIIKDDKGNIRGIKFTRA